MAALLLCMAAKAQAAWNDATSLWQERYYWDGLLQARDRVARSQSDPALLPAMRAIAGQTAQQVANLQQIEAYMQAQEGNLRFAFAQDDPQPSLATIGANFDTLARGAEQVRNNLYYLTVRCRLASSQALPDPEMYKAALLILGQVQQLQLRLNALYLATIAARRLVYENGWAVEKPFFQKTELLLRSVVDVQDSVFAVYNSGYALAMRSR